MKLAVIDVDGIIANIDARLAFAWQVYLQSVPDTLAFLRTKKHAEKSDIYWQTVYRSDLVELDTLIDGAGEALVELERRGYQIIFHTSRPDSMQEATRNWFSRYSLLTPGRRLVMKPSDMQVYTKLLKAIAIYSLANYLQVSEVVYVDDKQENIDEVGKYFTKQSCTIESFTSLAQAIAS
jgi:phosphoglycolate phosphatase-like HAD superfamily hydrolase